MQSMQSPLEFRIFAATRLWTKLLAQKGGSRMVGEKSTADVRRVTTRQTSIDAYNKIRADGLLTGRRLQVYQTLYMHGPLTARQVWRMVDPEAPTGSITTRLSELRDLSCVAEVGKVIEPETGHEVILWDVTPWLPVEKAPILKIEPAESDQPRQTVYDKAASLAFEASWFNAGVDAAKEAAVKFLVGRVIGYAGRIDLEKALEALKR